MSVKPIPGKDGDKYTAPEMRSGAKSVVFFTRDLSAQGLEKISRRVESVLSGKIAIKLHTGEKNGPNIIPRPWVRKLTDGDLKGATIVETNTYYEGDRYTTEAHRETLAVNGWDFCPVDIVDDDRGYKSSIPVLRCLGIRFEYRVRGLAGILALEQRAGKVAHLDPQHPERLAGLVRLAHTRGSADAFDERTPVAPVSCPCWP